MVILVRQGAASVLAAVVLLVRPAQGAGAPRVVLDEVDLPVELRHFRLTIPRSAIPQCPDAAQVSEIVLLEK